jgi:flavin reductase (DIM6/NTAB) family NADH-FMN oxidoreductase RutF
MFCPANKADGSKKDTLRNIEETGQFAVNIVSLPLLEAMNQSSAEYSAAESEFTAIGIDASNCDRIAVKRVTAARAVFECELHTLLGLGTGPGGANMVIGRIVAIHLDDAMLDSDGWPEHSQLAAVGRLGGTSYATTQDRMELARPKLGRAQS